MSFRGLTIAEAWRFGKEPFKFIIALVLKAMAFKGPKQWLPPEACEKFCDETQLSPKAVAHLVPLVQRARALGYTHGKFGTLTRNLDPHTKEGFSYLALHQDGMRTVFIGFVSSDSSGTVRDTVAVTGSLCSDAYDDIEFVNHGNYMDGTRTSRKIRVKGQQLEDIDRAMLDYIGKSRAAIRHFPSFDQMKAHAVAMSHKAYETRIARGLFVYVGEQP